MEFIDLTQEGLALWNDFDRAQVRPVGDPTELSTVLRETSFEVGMIEVDLPDYSCRRMPLVVHPTEGLWFIEVSDSTDAYPDIEDWRFDAYFEAWLQIADAFGWSEPPFRCALLFTELERASVIPDFARAPFDVFFRDDLPRLGRLLREHAPVRSRSDLVRSALGALQCIGRVEAPGAGFGVSQRFAA